MFEYRIDFINHKFENVKEEVNNGKLLLFAEWEVEELLIEAKALKKDVKFEHEINKLNSLITQLNQYLCDIQSLIEKNCSTTL